MNQRTAWRDLAVLAVLASCGLGAVAGAKADKEDEPEALPPAVVRAWRDAGADTGWLNDIPPEPADGYEHWEPFREEAKAGAVRAFRLHPKNVDVLAGLPDPGVPFGLDVHCRPVTGEWLKKLAGLKSLRSLNVGGSLVLTDDGVKEVAGLKGLRALYLFHAPVTDKGVRALAGLEELQVLDLSYTLVADGGLKELAGLKCLQALNLGETRVTDAGLKELAKMKGLRWLNLDRTKVTAGGVAALQADLPKCKVTSADD
jgi:hypothetical protein